MKKKILSIFSLAIMTLFATGCMKIHTNMDIKKDKSMDFSIVYGIDTSYVQNENILTDEEKKEFEQHGFSFSEYSEDTVKGFIIRKQFKNIDEISVNADAEYNLAELLNGKNSETYMFQIKKGFFKNTYTAKFNLNMADLNVPETNNRYNDFFNNSDTSDVNMSLDEDEIDDTLDNNDNNTQDIENTIISNLDIKFNVTLPYPAKSNNASLASDNDKEISRNLANTSLDTIEFEFELYNIRNVYIFIGFVIVLLIVIINIIIIFIKKKHKNNIKSNRESEKKKKENKSKD